MCGFVCIYSPERIVRAPSVLKKMTDAIAHRGPDDYGYAFIGSSGIKTWKEEIPEGFEGNGVEMGHRRLSILDLSDAGHQPFYSSDQRYWMVYNGEIYNYVELRQELISHGYVFRSKTDTEVVLAAYDKWGADCTQKFNGMWSLLIWDNQKKKLFVSRDRFGIKPLFYTRLGSTWLFSSEIKALLEYPGVVAEPDPAAVFRFLWSEDVPEGSDTFFQRIKSFEEAHYMEVGPEGVTINKYWSLPNSVTGRGICDEDKASELKDLLTDSVHIQLRSDVPVGTMLSGGLDSTSIAYSISTILKNASGGGKQRAISACYPGAWNDESDKIDLLANRLGIEVERVFPSDIDVSLNFDKVVSAVEQPFSGTMPIVQDIMMSRARALDIPVVLNGHGPDEMFAGYPARHCSFVAAEYLKRGKFVKASREISGMRYYHGISFADLCYSFLRISFPSAARLARSALRYSGRAYFQRDILKTYDASPSRFLDWDTIGETGLERRLRREFFSEIVPRYLAYEDRVSMLSSVESRVPFLDHRIVEFAFRLGDSDKIRHGITKLVLRNAMKGSLPAEIVDDHKKIYIESPFRQWFQGCLRGLVINRFFKEHSPAYRYVNPEKFRELMQRILDGSKCTSWELNLAWRVFTVDSWCRQFDKTGTSEGIVK